MSILEVTGLEAFYGDMQALFGIDVSLAERECLALVGANGAGKTTFARCLTGLIASKRGRIAYRKDDIAGLPAEKVARLGIAMVPEGRMLFASLSVEENLMMGSLNGRSGPWSLKRIYDLFPILQERRNQRAPTLSGGQQQMVAIGRALMANPDLLVCDEISLGLAPIVVGQIYEAFGHIRQEGTALVVVEQDIERALSLADRVICLLKGRVTLSEPARGIDMNRLEAAYFGG
jgi:branched-chain amino acid transport system ATP-binding protein